MENPTIIDIQDHLLKLMIYVSGICKTNNIEFWIDGGTLLGAVRSESFIGWDDDVDFCLLYKDYIKLNSILNKELEDHPFYFSYNQVKPNTYWSNYIGDTRILQDGIMPVRVDLIPIKSITNNELAIKTDESLVNLALFFNRGKIKNFKKITKPHTLKFLKNNRGRTLNQKELFSEYYFNHYMMKNSEKNKTHIFNYVFNDTLVKKEREYYNYNDIFPLKQINFGDYSFPAPQNISNYLSILYGDEFLTPPSVEQQIPYSYFYKKNILSKERTICRLKIFFKRDNVHFISRSSNYRLGQLVGKLKSYFLFVKNCIIERDPHFVYSNFIYSFKHIFYTKKNN